MPYCAVFQQQANELFEDFAWIRLMRRKGAAWNQSAGQKRSPHGEGNKQREYTKTKSLLSAAARREGSPDIGKGGCTLPTERGWLSMKCNFFSILICQKNLLKTYFFWQAVCLKAVTRQAAGLGPSENGIFGRKAMGVEKFNFFQCVGFVLRFV